MGVPVLLPQHHQIDARPLQLAREPSPIRLDPPAQARLHAGAREQALLEHGSVISAGKGQLRPAASARLRLSWTVRSRDAQRSPDLARAHPVAGKAQHLS